MKSFIRLVAVSAALSASPVLTGAATGSERSDASGTQQVRHDCGRDCCARHVTGQPGDVSTEQRDRDGWGGAG